MTQRKIHIAGLETLTGDQIAKFQDDFLEQWERKSDGSAFPASLPAIILAQFDDAIYSDEEQVNRITDYLDSKEYRVLSRGQFPPLHCVNYKRNPAGVSGYFNASDIIELAKQDYVEYICPNDVRGIRDTGVTHR